MKRCPECRRDYHDDSLMFCLDDGAHLAEGPSSLSEPATAVLHSTDDQHEGPTRQQIHMTDQADSMAGGPAIPAPAASQNKTYLLAAAVVLVLLLGGAFSYRYFGSGPKRIDSVAVLPLENGTGDAGLDYLSDGLSASLIDKLSQMPEVKVIARSSSFQFRGASPNIQDVAGKLRVDAIVMGKLSRLGDQLTVRVEVVDAAENKQIWGEQYVRRSDNLTALEQDIAQAVVEKLRLRLTGTQETATVKHESIDPRAYQLFLQAEYFAHAPDGQMEKAIGLYEQAVQMDPLYSLAYADLSMAYGSLVAMSKIDPKVGVPKQEASARRAVELDNRLAEGRMALGLLHLYKWQWAEAERELKWAVELNPNLGAARRYRATQLVLTGSGPEAVAECARGMELDPLSLGAYFDVAWTDSYSRRFDHGIETARRALAIDPKFINGYWVLGANYLGKGSYADARDAFNKILEMGDTSPSTRIYLGVALAGLGERDKALKILAEFRSRSEYVSPAELAVLLTALGMKDEAIASLEKGFEARDLQMATLKVEPGYDPLRTDRRFIDLLHRVGFTD